MMLSGFKVGDLGTIDIWLSPLFRSSHHTLIEQVLLDVVNRYAVLCGTGGELDVYAWTTLMVTM